MVHIFFVLKYVFEVVAGMQTHKACPHCTHCAHERERERAGPVGVAGYEGVPQDEEGRVSLDETVVDGGKDVV